MAGPRLFQLLLFKFTPICFTHPIFFTRFRRSLLNLCFSESLHPAWLEDLGYFSSFSYLQTELDNALRYPYSTSTLFHYNSPAACCLVPTGCSSVLRCHRPSLNKKNHAKDDSPKCIFLADIDTSTSLWFEILSLGRTFSKNVSLIAAWQDHKIQTS